MNESTTTENYTFLTCTLSEEIFALDINTVREVLELSPMTRIPRTPKFMCGVINLRGHAVPVVDLRQKLGMEKTGCTVDTCIIIVEIPFHNEMTIMGALVDSVREVFEMRPEDIEPAPKLGTAIRSDLIKGMGHLDDRFIIIVDIAKLFSEEELAFTHDLQEESARQADEESSYAA